MSRRTGLAVLAAAAGLLAAAAVAAFAILAAPRPVRLEATVVLREGWTIFDLAREHEVDPKDFFAAIYQVLLGQERGPRFGSFARLVGLDRVVALIDEHVR